MLASYTDILKPENTANAPYRNQVEELDSRGVTIFNSNDFNSIQESNYNCDQFAAYWDDLESDQYMKDKGLYRKRRFGRYRYNTDTLSLSIVGGDHEFYQSEEINQLNGGKSRKFAPVNKKFVSEDILTSVINRCVQIITCKRPEFDSLMINTHLIRIVCGSGIVGFPTPEGIHRDGHCFVSQHLISRKNVYGGVSGIYNLNNEPLVHFQLFNFMDTILIDDSIVKHDVSPVYSADKSSEGYRDMLIVDYNFA